MAAQPPTVYLLYGDDQRAIAEFLARIKQKMGDPSSAEMNIDHFSAAGLDIERFAAVCQAMPFLTQRRLVILESLTLLLKDPDVQARIFELLSNLPHSTALVLIEQFDFKTRKGKLPARLTHLIQWLQEEPQKGAPRPKAFIQVCRAPTGKGFVEWLRRRSKEAGGDISSPAASLLAELVDEDVLQADQELEKLLNYVDRSRPIEIEDVERLTPFRGQSNIFEMVDALGQRDASKALRTLHYLMESEDPRYLFGMVVRQFRLLIQVRECIDSRLDPKQSLKLHPFVLSKLTAQAKNFSLEGLENIYHQLLTLDVGVKTGQVKMDVALEQLTASLAR